MKLDSLIQRATLFLLCIGALICVYAQSSAPQPPESTLSQGKALFIARYSFSIGKDNWDIASADFNRDGSTDIVSLLRASEKLVISYNDGLGQFEDTVSLPIPPQSRGVSVLDANGDKWQDVAVVCTFGEIDIYINDGKGRLYYESSLRTEMVAQDLAIGDINADGAVDIAVAILNDNAVYLYKGDGTGKFSRYITVETGVKPRTLRCADFNIDGYADIAVGTEDGAVYVYLNRGDGSFNTGQRLTANTDTWGLALADFDGNGSIDIASCSYTEREVCVFLNQGAGKFAQPQRLVAGEHNFDIQSGDLDGDGDIDLASCSANDNQIYCYFNTGTGIFSSAKTYLSGYWNSALTLSDLDNDGDIDIATSSINDGRINIHRNLSEERKAMRPTIAAIRGNIFNADLNMPMSGTPLLLLNDNGETIASTITNEIGCYELPTAGEDTYTLAVRSSRMPMFFTAVEVMQGDVTTDLKISPKKQVLLVGMIRAIGVGGISRAKVRLYNAVGKLLAQCYSTQSGFYRLPAPSGERLTLQVSHAQFAPKSIAISPVGGNFLPCKNDIELMPNQRLATILGKVTRQPSADAVAHALITFTDASGSELARTYTNNSGMYSQQLPAGDYAVTASAENTFFDSRGFALTPAEAGREFGIDLTLRDLVPSASVVLEGIYFRQADYRIDAASLPALQRIWRMLSENPHVVVEIAGHTDSDGSDVTNMRLSANRAQSVANFLVENGILPYRLTVKGYGETRPQTPNTTLENKAKNRRIELTILSNEPPIGSR